MGSRWATALGKSCEISDCSDEPSVRSVSVRVILTLVGLCLGCCVDFIELAKSSTNLWGFCTLFALIPGIDDQGAVGGAGEPSGPSVLLSPRSIPKDKGGVPWAPSPPVTASGISYWFIVRIPVHPRNFVR